MFSIAVNQNGFDTNPLMNSIDFIWSKQTVAAGDTAVLHCSFDAIFSQLRNGNVSIFLSIFYPFIYRSSFSARHEEAAVADQLAAPIQNGCSYLVLPRSARCLFSLPLNEICKNKNGGNLMVFHSLLMRSGRGEGRTPFWKLQTTASGSIFLSIRNWNV